MDPGRRCRCGENVALRVRDGETILGAAAKAEAHFKPMLRVNKSEIRAM